MDNVTAYTLENKKCVGYPFHLAHLFAGKRAKELPVNVEDFIIYTITFEGVQNEIRNKQLRVREFMNLTITKLEK